MKTIQPCVYLLGNRNAPLHVGVTSQPAQRIGQHRGEATADAIAKYGIPLLLWFERHATMDAAIRREKEIRRWNRQGKIRLIEERNAQWRDLSGEIAAP